MFVVHYRESPLYYSRKDFESLEAAQEFAASLPRSMDSLVSEFVSPGIYVGIDWEIQ